MTALVPADLGPGMVPTGFAEGILEQAAKIDDPARLYDAATSLAAYAHKWNGHGAEKREIKTAQMYCEVELGQHLGPNPGQGTRSDIGTSAMAEVPIPSDVMSRVRRFHGHRDWLIEQVREGKVSRRSLLLALDRANAVHVDRAEVDIRCGHFLDVLQDLDPGTVALVLTDPPYPVEYLPLWSDLGEFAADILTDGGSLVAYCGQSILPEALHRLRAHLRYWWILALLHQYGTAMIPGKKVSAGWKPLVWFVKNRRATDVMLADRINGTSPRKTIPVGDTGDWAQGVDELEPIISALTVPGDLIVDPFAGTGSTGIAALRFGRRFIGAEING